MARVAKRSKPKPALLLALVAAGLLVVYGVSIVRRTHPLYDAAKEGGRGWKGRLYESDPELGLRAIPGARAYETFPIGPDVPSRISRDGFRIPIDANEDAPRRRPVVLALGCSVTYGATCVAEDAFAYRVAEGLDGTCLNAGVCSGGLAQMLILARRLVPEVAPDFVLVQRSPWLALRSSRDWAPTNLGRITTPVFVQTDEGITIEPPAFGTLAFSVPAEELAETPRGLLDFLAFELRVGLPLLVHDDACERWLDLRRAVGWAARPAPPQAAEAVAYAEIRDLCAAGGARMIVVAFDNEPLSDPRPPPAWLENLDVPIAEASERLRALLPALTSEAYASAYQHVRGDPPVWIDKHPNPRAHGIIARTILERIEGSRPENGPRSR